MKIRLPISLLAFVPVAPVIIPMANGAAPTDLGDVMYVGDSITHGVNAGSYRWAMHKILVDAGISYDAEGVKTGNFSNGVANGTMYGNVAFENVHSSQASARAWELSGRSSGSRFNGSNITNWLGQSTVQKNGATYSGVTFTGDDTPETFFLLIGTNDLLSDGNNSTLNTRIDSATTTLLGDMDLIYNSMCQANANANIVVLGIPCWTAHANGNSADTHRAVETYNASLKDWATTKSNVTYVEVNKGMVDVAAETPFYGVSSMFNTPGTDGLHPNAQGDLIMAGNVAKAMGYAGRSAGQQRKAAKDLAVNFHSGSAAAPTWTGISQLTTAGFATSNVTVSSAGINMGGEGRSEIGYSWAENDMLVGGFTLDIDLSLGDGNLNGWNVSDDLSITLGTDSFTGTLNINEAYIKWGNTILYSTDMAANTETLRMSWLAGNSSENLSAGYYVWLGDMLIGEALGVTYETGKSGLSISYEGTGNALIKDLALDGNNSYAPTTTGVVNTEAAYVSKGADLPAQGGEPQGNVDWKTTGFTHTNASAKASGTYNARSAADSGAGASGNAVNVEIKSGNATHIYANSGDYKGDV